MSQYALTGGSPWGTVLGTDGAIYVTQGGNVPGSGDTSAVSGIQRVQPDGTVELLFSEVAGYTLYGPNDLAFGPDGRLCFTESGSEQDFRFDVRSPGRLFVAGPDGDGRDAARAAGCLPERDRLRRPAAPVLDRVGGAPGAAGSMTGRRSRSASCRTPTCPTAWRSPRTAACSCAPRSRGITVISPDGEVLEEISLGEHATNCIFDGSALYVTATKVPDIEASQRTGTFWRVRPTPPDWTLSPASSSRP